MSDVNQSMEKTEREKRIEALMEKSKELQNMIAELETQRKLKIQEIKKQTNDLLTA